MKLQVGEPITFSRSLTARTFAVLGAVVVVVVPVVLAAYFIGRHGAIEYNLEFREPRGFGRVASPEAMAGMVEGSTLYVPAYSHIYVEDGQATLLTVTLSVRNVSSEHELVLTRVDYFDTAGRKLRSDLDQPLLLEPLQSTEFLVKARDTDGGSGANFLVDWLGEPGAPPPLVEAIMVGRTGSGTLAFSRSGIDVTKEP